MDSTIDASEDSPRDHSTGLIAFGLLAVLVGVLLFAKFVIFALLSIPGVMPSRFGTEVPLTAAMALPPAAFFLALGLGSIAARRWARAIAFASALVWLAAGLLALVFLGAWLPRLLAAVRPMMASAGSGARSSVVRACMALGVVGFVLPLLAALFYGSAGVRRECESRDAQDRWTDRLSPAALSLVLALSLAALLALQVAFSATRQRLYFGHPLEGAARAGWALLASAEIAAAAGLAGRRRWAGGAAVAAMLARAAAVVVIARRVAASPDAIFAATRRGASPEDDALMEALRPLHWMSGVTAYVEVLSIAALVLAIAVALSSSSRRRATGA